MAPVPRMDRCQFFKELDHLFNTDHRSPLHHDNRCECMKKKK